MAASKNEKNLRRPPATTPQARENQLSAMAYDYAEKQFRDGTISSQTLNHFLKAGSTIEMLQKQKIVLEQELLKARVEAMGATNRLEELTEDALTAFKTYAGNGDDDDYY